MQVSAYRGGRIKLDEMFSFSKKSKGMKNLFGSLLKKGIDKDHQHGIELPAPGSRPARRDESDEEEEDGNEEQENGGGGGDESSKGDEAGEGGSRSAQGAQRGHSEEGGDEDDGVGAAADDSMDQEDEAVGGSSGPVSSRRPSDTSLRRSSKDSSSVTSSKNKFMRQYYSDSDDENHESAGKRASPDADEASQAGIESLNSAEPLRHKENIPAVQLPLDEESSTLVADKVTDIRIEQVSVMQFESSGALEELPTDAQNEEEITDEMRAKTAASEESDDHDDVVVDEELAAKIKAQSQIVNNAIEEIVTGEELPVTLEEEKDEGSESEEEELGDVWDYATAMNGEDYAPFRVLVCMPPTLSASKNVRQKIDTQMNRVLIGTCFRDGVIQNAIYTSQISASAGTWKCSGWTTRGFLCLE